MIATIEITKNEIETFIRERIGKVKGIDTITSIRSSITEEHSCDRPEFTGYKVTVVLQENI